MSLSRVPEVSIGLPVYNGQAHLATSLESLLGQTFEDLEVVISDNHSTDGTESICRDFAARDPRVRYIRAEENRGAAWNFDQAFHLARGRYFKWASSNDVHDPDYVRDCYDVLQSHPEAALVYGKTVLIDQQGAVIEPYEDHMDLPWPDAPRRFREFLARIGLCNALYGLMRPETIRRTGLLGRYPGSDIVFLGELTLHGTFVEVTKPLLRRRFDGTGDLKDTPIEEWRRHFEPATQGKVSMRTWRHQYEYFLAALRAPLSAADKARVIGTILRVCITIRRELVRELAGSTPHGR